MNAALPLILLWLSHFLIDFMIGMWAVYKAIVSLDLAIAGIITTFAALIGEGSQLFFGGLGDRGNYKRLILFGGILTMANVFLPFSESYFVVFLLFLTTCIGSGAFHPCAAAHLSNLTNQHKGLFISIFASGGALGMALSQIVFTQAYTHFEGNTLILATPSILLSLLLISFGYLRKNEPNIKMHSTSNLKLFKEFFQKMPLRMLFITQACNQIIYWAFIFLLPNILISRGYPEEIAYGKGHMVFIMGAAVTMIPCGYLADRFSSRIVIFTSTLLTMFFFFLFLLTPSLSPSYLLLTLFTTGALIGITQPVAVAFGNHLERKNSGAISAFTMGLVWCVATIAPAGTGLVSKLFVEDAAAQSLLVFGILFPPLLYASYQLPQSTQSTKLATE